MLRLARNVAVLVSLAVAPASADRDDKGHKFPMAAAEYTKHLDRRLAHVGERLDKRMTEAKLDATKQTAARKRLAANATELRALAKKHGADGTVTEAEANEINARGRVLRNELYKEFGLPIGKREKE